MKAGQQVTLTCESSLSNPKAVITWYSRGKIVSANSDTVYTPGSNGGFTSRSSVTVTMSEQENNAMYICNAVSDNRAPVATANVTLSVLCEYQPWLHLVFSLHLCVPVHFFSSPNFEQKNTCSIYQFSLDFLHLCSKKDCREISIVLE